MRNLHDNSPSIVVQLLHAPIHIIFDFIAVTAIRQICKVKVKNTSLIVATMLAKIIKLQSNYQIRINDIFLFACVLQAYEIQSENLDLQLFIWGNREQMTRNKDEVLVKEKRRKELK